jgi:hypothetical protein
MADRVKHQVVRFENGRARVYITDDISNIVEDETTLINPDRSYVMGVSPEFWTIKDGKLWPIEDEKRIAEINASAAVLAPSSDLKRIEIVQHIESLQRDVEFLNTSSKAYSDQGDFALSKELTDKMLYINDTIGEVVKLIRVSREEVLSDTKAKLDEINKRNKRDAIILYSLIAVAMSIAIFL